MSRPSDDPSVFNEPHMRSVAGLSGVKCWKCGYDRTGLAVGAVCPECGADEFEGGSVRSLAGQDGAELAEQSVFEEPTFASELGGGRPADARTYSAWLEDRRARTTPGATWIATLALALAAGPWAIFGAMCGGIAGEGAVTEAGAVSLLAIIVFGPIMEEVMKVAAATWAIERRPYLFSSRAQILVCAVAGALVFAAIENVMYLGVYIEQPTRAIVVWRWTVCVALHVCCSFIAGLGLAAVWKTSMAMGKAPDLGRGAPLMLTAVVVHGAYNLLAVLLEGLGVL